MFPKHQIDTKQININFFAIRLDYLLNEALTSESWLQWYVENVVSFLLSKVSRKSLLVFTPITVIRVWWVESTHLLVSLFLFSCCFIQLSSAVFMCIEQPVCLSVQRNANRVVIYIEWQFGRFSFQTFHPRVSVTDNRWWFGGPLESVTLKLPENARTYICMYISYVILDFEQNEQEGIV